MHPLRRPPYPHHPRAMTVALGAVYDSGILLCADSLVTTNTLGWYESKIRGWRIDGADLIFAIAGAVAFAESAVNRCKRKFVTLANRNIETIESEIRDELESEYKRHRPKTEEEYWLLAVLRTSEGIKLLKCQRGLVNEVSKGIEFIGAGEDLARFLLEPAHHKFLSEDELSSMAAHAVGLIKKRMPGIVGGDNVMMLLSNGGHLSWRSKKELDLIEWFGNEYHRHAAEVLRSALIGTNDDDACNDALERFYKAVQSQRVQLRNSRDKMPGAPPLHALSAVEDLRSA